MSLLFSFSHLNKLRILRKPIKQKTLQNWRQKQRAISKQKRLRKEFKLLLTKNQRSQQKVFLLPNRKKRSESPSGESVPQDVFSPEKASVSGKEGSNRVGAPFWAFFEKRSLFQFERERSPQRRYRVRRNRGIFNKRDLGELFKKDIQKVILNPKSSKVDSPQKRMQRQKFYSKLSLFGLSQKRDTLLGKSEGPLSSKLSSELSPQESLIKDNGVVLRKTGSIKLQKNKKRKLRAWKQKKRSLGGSQKRRNYLKRRRYSRSKTRVLRKHLKRIKQKLEMHQWWWKHYFQSLQGSTDALWQIEKDKLIAQKLSELSVNSILARDLGNSAQLQIGNKDFKPLALPETLRRSFTSPKEVKKEKKEVRQTLSSQSSPVYEYGSYNSSPDSAKQITLLSLGKESSEKENTAQNVSHLLSPTDPNETNPSFPFPNAITLLYENLFVTPKKNLSVQEGFGLIPSTSLPFYAGWDESLRQFVVTNRFLSRQEAGYEIDKSFVFPKKKAFFEEESAMAKRYPQPFSTFSLDMGKKEKFSEAPLQGMNAATTLYWQLPFTTYDPDQFFALGMDGFSPITWRKMLYRHSILKSWLGTNQRNESYDLKDRPFKTEKVRVKRRKMYTHKDLVKSLKKRAASTEPIFSPHFRELFARMQKGKKNRGSSNSLDRFRVSRRLKKRLARVKKHPRTPVWFPSGPLVNQVLPVHYIYVFYKRSRLPRNRYLGRRLLKRNAITNSETLNQVKLSSFFSQSDFTLRKRLKPKRKYHLKHDTSLVIPRRFRFLRLVPHPSSSSLSFDQRKGLLAIDLRGRPVSSQKKRKSFAELRNELKLLRTKRQQRLTKALQTDQPSLRVKQLKRRVHRNIVRSIWRYRPRRGGFVWPGDYLRFENSKVPKLKDRDLQNESLPARNRKESDSAAADVKKEESLLRAEKKEKKKKKKKRQLVEWQIQPKNYLYKKHNRKVLQKRLERANRSGSFELKKKELEFKLKR